MNRHKPREILHTRFSQTYRRLNAWQSAGGGQVEYFTVSAFGRLGPGFSTPNVLKISRNQDDGVTVVKNLSRWRPFGLVAPIYWLCTGERHKGLEKD